MDYLGCVWIMDIDKAMELGILTPASKLHLSDDEKKDYKRGLIIYLEPEVIVYGHVVSGKKGTSHK